jgi:hypothetical protein
VSNRYPVANDAGIHLVVDMEDAIVLDAGLIADSYVVDVSADCDIQPHTSAVAYHYVTNNLGA